jgi:glyceraldehyde 3-phosphate dehydrogenase
MKTVKIGVNGVGRIGRTVLRAYFTRLNEDKNLNIEIVAINNPGDTKAYIHLLKHDSLHGKLKGDFSYDSDSRTITYNGRKIKFFDQKNPEELDWSSVGAQVVIDATGIFKDKAKLGLHMRGTVKKVIMCAPGKDLDGTFVMGINLDKYDSSGKSSSRIFRDREWSNDNCSLLHFRSKPSRQRPRRSSSRSLSKPFHDPNFHWCCEGPR